MRVSGTRSALNMLEKKKQKSEERQTDIFTDKCLCSECSNVRYERNRVSEIELHRKRIKVTERERM